MLDLTNLKKKTEIDNAIKENILEQIYAYLDEHEAEYRKLGKQTEIKLAKTLDKDGETVDIWVGLNFSIHKYFVTTSPKTGKILPAFDIEKETEKYRAKQIEK